MDVSSQLAPNIANVPNYHSLALFICHLFVDGNFKTAHFLNDPKIFDGHIMNEIVSICPRHVPWIMTDVTQKSSLPWQQNERLQTDNVLQLIFLDSNNLIQEIDNFKKYFVFYRLFIFSGTDEITMTKDISAIKKTNPSYNASSLTLHYTPTNGSISVLSMQNSGNDVDNAIDSTAISTNVINIQDIQNISLISGHENLFSRTFGEYERKWSMAIKVPAQIAVKNGHTTYINIDGNLQFANFFYSYLNATYINMTCIASGFFNCSWKHQQYIHKNPELFKELSLEYGNSLKSNEISANNLYLDYYSVKKDERKVLYSLYPYQSIELYIMFVYGSDYKREKDILFTPSCVRTLSCTILSVAAGAALILCLARRKLKLQRNGIISSFIDALVAFIGRGTLQMDHKFEKWFFGILMIGGFFMVALWTGELLYFTYRALSSKITTFDQLASVKTPVYTFTTLTAYDSEIQGLLRRKIGPKMHYMGDESIHTLFKKKTSFILAFQRFDLDQLRIFAEYYDRDVDFLHDILGSISTRYYLSSNQRVSERVLQKIDKITGSMMENGLRQFYINYGAFSHILHARKFTVKTVNFHPFAVDRISSSLLLFTGILIVAGIFFGAEMAFPKWKKSKVVQYNNHV